MPDLFLLVNTREPQSMNAKLFYTFVGQPLSKQLYTPRKSWVLN